MNVARNLTYLLRRHVRAWSAHRFTSKVAKFYEEHDRARARARATAIAKTASTNVGKSTEWDVFLKDGETILFTGATHKRKGYSNKRRQLILSKSVAGELRLFYVDPSGPKVRIWNVTYF